MGLGEILGDEAHALLDLVISKIKDEVKLALSFRDDLTDMENQLMKLSWLIEGAVRSNSNPFMAYWLQRIRSCLFEAEDLVDGWSYEVLKRKFRTKKRHKVKSTVAYPFYRQRMARKVRQMKKLIDNIYTEARNVGISPVEAAAVKTTQQRLEVPRHRNFVAHKMLIGRHRDVYNVVGLCCNINNNRANLSVIAIVGIGGMGKTALARHITEIMSVKKYFNNKVIWIVVSQNFDLHQILKTMASSLYETNLGKIECDLILVSMIKAKLEEEKFLIVLDDIWSTIEWESIFDVLREVGKCRGNVVLVTSRSANVVSRLETYSYNSLGERTTITPVTYPLRGLEREDSVSLFVENVGVENLKLEEQELIADRLIMRCDGIPLAIITIARVLRYQNLQGWREIETSNIWRKDEQSGILPSLKVSFEYLPNIALKKCFSYCAIYEEGEIIEKSELISMWMAQGYLQPYDAMEVVGESYVSHLIDACLLQVAHTDAQGDVCSLKMHDVVLALARDISSKEILRVDCLNESMEECMVSLIIGMNEVRHLSVISGTELIQSSLRKLRTYIDRKSVPSLHFLKHCKNLRVLAVDCTTASSMKDLGKLKFLKYLSITLKNFEMLPKEIKNLFHLQTLLIQVGVEAKPFLPSYICELPKLRHIFVNCSISIPNGISHLSELQTLPEINFEHHCGGIGEISLLKQLTGRVEFSNLDYITAEQARSLQLKEKARIHHLILRWDCEEVNEQQDLNEVLEALHPNNNLSVLWVYHHSGTRFPTWLMATNSPLQNLVSLLLHHCSGEGFLNLENFKFLRYLSLKACKSLGILPSSNGFQTCNSLKEISIIDCLLIRHLPDLSPLTDLTELKFGWLENSGKKYKGRLVGLASLTSLRCLWTDEGLPKDLDEHSPVCQSLENVRLFDDHAETLPAQLQHLVALKHLEVNGYARLEALPEWFGNLTSLQYLSLSNMSKLKHLPSHDAMKRLSNLIEVEFKVCPVLDEQLRNKQGEEWSKVAHVCKVTVVDYL